MFKKYSVFWGLPSDTCAHCYALSWVESSVLTSPEKNGRGPTSTSSPL